MVSSVEDARLCAGGGSSWRPALAGPSGAGTGVPSAWGVGFGGSSALAAGAGGVFGADGGGAAGAGFAAASFAPPITASTLLTATVSPTCARISDTTPAAGDGISASTLSVEISKSGSSRSTVSPTFLIQRTIVPSAIDSPICGITTSVDISILEGLVQRSRFTVQGRGSGFRVRRQNAEPGTSTLNHEPLNPEPLETSLMYRRAVHGVGRFAHRFRHGRMSV